MRTLRYNKLNCDVMIEHEEKMTETHKDIWRKYVNRFSELGLKLELTFFWSQCPRKGFFRNKYENYYSRPKIKMDNYSYFAHYEIQKDGKTVNIVMPNGEHAEEDGYETLYISDLRPGGIVGRIDLYDETNYVIKMLDSYLFKLKNFKYDTEGIAKTS